MHAQREKTKQRAAMTAVALALTMLVAACSNKSEGGATQAASASEASAISSAHAKSAESKSAESKGASAAVNPSLSVSTVLPKQSNWPITVAANGSIAAWHEAVIGAEVGGLRLENVQAQVGDRVRKGDVLAVLRQDSLRSDVALAKANVAEAQAMLSEARANAERARSLQPTDMISKQDALRAYTAEQTALARLESARARLAADELRLVQTKVVAPDDGIISARQATVGAVVQPGQELFRLVRQGRLEWRAEVAATDLQRIKPDMTVALSAAGSPGLTGTVRMVAPTVDAATRNGLVYVDLAAKGLQASGIKPGMFASGQFDVGQAQGLTVPQTAVLLRDGFAYVFKLGADNKVNMTKVQVGRRMGDRVEVVQGLDAKTPVVASGVGFLTDGDTVHVVASAQ